MAVNNNAVQIVAGLSCNVLSQPPIGVTANGTIGFTDGDKAGDDYKSVVSTSAGTPTALHTDLGGAGFLLVINPTSGVDVTLYAGTTKLGVLPGGLCCVIPVASGVIIGGVVASTAQTVGVTIIKTTPNV